MEYLIRFIFLAIFFVTSFSQANTDQQEQIKSITDYYKRYLNHEYEDGWPSIFSSRLIKALDANINDCRKFVRNGNICGYTADGDLLLNTQDYSETLTFSNSQFLARSKPHNLIQVSFVLFPEDDEKGERKITFTMMKEGTQWKIDDIESLAYKSMNSERDVLIEMNRPLENATMDLQIAFEAMDYKYFSLFLSKNTQICSKKTCKIILQNDIANIYQTIFDKYYLKTGDYTVESKKKLIPSETINISVPAEGNTAKTGLFTWQYIDQLWMITKIDFDLIK